jgi:hypothetical protein
VFVWNAGTQADFGPLLADTLSADDDQPALPEPQFSTAEVRAWARLNGIEVPDRGRLRPAVVDAWRRAQAGSPRLITRPDRSVTRCANGGRSGRNTAY